MLMNRHPNHHPQYGVKVVPTGKGTILVQGMQGLGDNIYQRPFIRNLVETENKPIMLSTPWPELFQDIPNLAFYKPRPILRTQNKNIEAQDKGVWSPIRALSKVITPSYASAMVANRTVLYGLQEAFHCKGLQVKMDLPDYGPSPVAKQARGKPIAVVRPVTRRKEWDNESRNPLPEYIYWVSRQLINRYYVVVVADLEEDKEWALNPFPASHAQFLGGELRIKQLMALIASAKVVVGGVGWIVPACLAYSVPAFVVMGGCGTYNHPQKIVDERIPASKKIGFAVPSKLCMCSEHHHACDKQIPDIESQFNAWANYTRILR